VIGRRQLAVASPISGRALARALVASVRGDGRTLLHARSLVTREFAARTAVLTDSGTSALVLALRATAGDGGTVALPAYGCVDLVAAALFARVRIRLYDIDPRTLSPDLDSVRRVIERGVDAIVVAHLFGYAADVVGVEEIAQAGGVRVVEDAAQGAGGSLVGQRLGSIGGLAVLSFGRGKGLCAGGGGALLANRDDSLATVDAVALPIARRGWGQLASTAVQWVLGRPFVYALPAALPWLHLGEMVYHPASEPTEMSLASASLVPSALGLEPRDVAVRRANARALEVAISAASGVTAVQPIALSQSGYLRFAVRDVGGERMARASLGIVRPYPGTLAEYPEIRPALVAGEPTMRGAGELARSLLTLPSHRFVSRSDVVALGEWMKNRH
jgi:perosamine synthetase